MSNLVGITIGHKWVFDGLNFTYRSELCEWGRWREIGWNVGNIRNKWNVFCRYAVKRIIL